MSEKAEKQVNNRTEQNAVHHLPFRDSKLTRIMQPSLSGNSQIVVICTISPALRYYQYYLSTSSVLAQY